MSVFLSKYSISYYWSYGESQFMFEQIYLDRWNVDTLDYPLGGGKIYTFYRKIVLFS